jgi:hypothetical protein
VLRVRRVGVAHGAAGRGAVERSCASGRHGGEEGSDPWGQRVSEGSSERGLRRSAGDRLSGGAAVLVCWAREGGGRMRGPLGWRRGENGPRGEERERGAGWAGLGWAAGLVWVF